ncbi:unnamed protein product [Peronospora belbahrii]|uniref:Uncharacterized protein n=1 Tax=Peronospora belbahrii TaxID=622444 RepID=A0AAU9KZD0_9STRA|nr:unnamed protein product [Peronospora belbahrii]
MLLCCSFRPFRFALLQNNNLHQSCNARNFDARFLEISFMCDVHFHAFCVVDLFHGHDDSRRHVRLHDMSFGIQKRHVGSSDETMRESAKDRVKI